jgi:hypothetical protein
MVPLVDKGLVIPQPGIHMDPDKALEINKNTMLSLRTRTAYGKTLGGVILAGRPGSSGPFGMSVSQLKNSKYPVPAKPGTIKTCYLPPWLEIFSKDYVYDVAPITTNGLADEDAGKKAEKAMQERTEKIKANKSEYEQFVDAFTRSVYFAEATKGNGATLTTVLNLGICPGTVVKIPVPDDVTIKGTEHCYGTVHTAQYTIGPESAVSSFVLSNVRTENQMREMSTTDALLYQSGWYNHEQTLYVKEL